jgi:hypothetical protein
MGLDTVELVMDIEEAFDISIPDDRASQMLTVGDVYEFILEKTTDSTLSSKTCLTAATFYELRTILRSAGIKNTDIRPRTRIDRVFPLLGRRSNWKTMSSKMGLRFPRLERPSWLTLVNCMVVAALVFGTFLTFAKPKVSDGIAMASVAGTIGSFILYLLKLKKRGQEPMALSMAFQGNFVSAALATWKTRRATVMSLSTFGRRLFSCGSDRSGRWPTTAHQPCC